MGYHLEKRKLQRFEIDNNEIGITMAFANYVEVLNISLGGISLKVDRRLTLGSTYPFKIMIHGKVTKAKGTIVWSSLSESREDAKGNIIPIYKAGLQFTDITGEALNEIFRFVEHKKQNTKELNNSEYVNFGLEDLDIQETDKKKIETVFDSLYYK
jgi:hypothetical protein